MNSYTNFEISATKTLTCVTVYGHTHTLTDDNFLFYRHGFTKPKEPIHSTPPIMKKNVEILLHYRWLFIKGDIIIGEWAVFGAEIFLCYSQFFLKGDFIIGRVECKCCILDYFYPRGFIC